MCLAIPGKIKKLKSKEIAEVDFNGLFKDVNISLVDVKNGDYVIVHAGFAIEKMETKEAGEIRKYLKKN